MVSAKLGRAIGLMVLTVACGGEEVEADRPFVPAAGSTPPQSAVSIPEVPQRYAEALNVDLSQMELTPGGVRYRDLAVGTGVTAVPGHRIQAAYSGWLSTGEFFESGVYPPPLGQPLVLGTRSVIRGWDEGIVGMRVGGTRQLVIPPELAYGEAGSGTIPGGATLVFEIQLLSAGN